VLRWPIAVCLALCLAACGDEGASAPGEVSPGEAKALEDAASMLDERRLPPEAVPAEPLTDVPVDPEPPAPTRN